MSTQLPSQFLVRRKSDGKYYLNGGYRARMMASIDDSKDYSWTDNPQACKPFKSTSGAKNAIGGIHQKIVGKKREQLIKQYVPANFNGGRVRFKHNGSQYYYTYIAYVDAPYKQLNRVVKFDERYEIIKVKVSIEIK